MKLRCQFKKMFLLVFKIKLIIFLSILVVSCNSKGIENTTEVDPAYKEKLNDFKDVNSNKEVLKDILTDINNDTISLNKISNKKYKVIKIWASWCEPCLKTMPEFIANIKKYKNHTDIDFISISIDDGFEYWSERISKFESKENQFLAGGSEKTNIFKLSLEIQKIEGKTVVLASLPNYFVLDKDSRLQHNFVMNQRTDQEVIDYVKKLE